MLSPDMCNQLETTTVGNKLEAVRREHNHGHLLVLSHEEVWA